MKGNQWLIVGLTAAVAVLATLLVVEHLAPARVAYAQETTSGSTVLSLMGQLDPGTKRSPLFVIDTRSMSILVYEYDWNTAVIYLRGVRSFRNDRNLTDAWFIGNQIRVKPAPTVDDIGKALLRP